MAKKNESAAAVLATDVHLYDESHPVEAFAAGTAAADLPEWALAVLHAGHPIWSSAVEVEVDETAPTVNIQVG